MTTASAGLQGDNVGRMSSLFYADDGAIRSLDDEWLQNANQHLCNLFRDYTGLKPNTEKTETMSCHPESGDGARWKAINTDTKAPETLTPRGKGKELCVPFLLVVKTWHWDPYNLTYVRNTEWVQSSPNQQH